MTLPYPLLARGKINTDMSWIFFDTATPKRGVQLSHDIESISCNDAVIRFDFREESGGLSLSTTQPSRSRKLPILVSFPSKEAADTAFVGMAEQMAKQSGNWFVSLAPELSEREAIRNARVAYPFTDSQGGKFRIEQDGKIGIIFQYEDGTRNIFPLDFFPEAPGE